MTRLVEFVVILKGFKVELLLVQTLFQQFASNLNKRICISRFSYGD
jgi:hypothetical protein